jgi:hypothetical protein
LFLEIIPQPVELASRIHRKYLEQKKGDELLKDLLIFSAESEVEEQLLLCCFSAQTNHPIATEAKESPLRNRCTKETMRIPFVFLQLLHYQDSNDKVMLS